MTSPARRLPPAPGARRLDPAARQGLRRLAAGHAAVLVGAVGAAVLLLAGVLGAPLPPVGVGFQLAGLVVLGAGEVLALLLVRALARADSLDPPRLVLAVKGVGLVLAGPLWAGGMACSGLQLDPPRPVVVATLALGLGGLLVTHAHAEWVDRRIAGCVGGAGRQVLQRGSRLFVDVRRRCSAVLVGGLTALAAGLGVTTAAIEPLRPAALVHLAAATSVAVLGSVLLRGVLAGPVTGGVDAVERAAVDRAGRVLCGIRWPAVGSVVLVVAGAALPYSTPSSTVPLIAMAVPGLLGYLLVWGVFARVGVSLLRLGIGRGVRSRWPLPLDDRVVRAGELAHAGWAPPDPVRPR